MSLEFFDESPKNRQCPACAAIGHDKMSDHLFLMSDGNRWCCTKAQYHADGEVYYEDVEKAEEGATGTLDEQLADLEQLIATGSDHEQSTDLPVSTPIGIAGEVKDTYRGILPATYKHFKTEGLYTNGVLTELQHELYEVGTNSIICRKIRKLPKDFFCTSKTKGTQIQLFGQSVFSRAKKILIVEGEFDAMSGWQMFQASKYTKGVAVISLPLGANIKSLMDNMDYLKQFKEVYVCCDQDEAGRKVSRDIASLFPHSKHMRISGKDANEMLVDGKEAEFISAFFDAEIFQPDTIVRVKDIMSKVLEVPVMGVPYPWESLTKATYGRRGGEGMYVGAGVKIGKSEFINELIKFDLAAGRKIGILKYEEPPAMTIKRVAGKIDGIAYHRPGVIYKTEDLERTALAMHDNLFMYPAFGPATWESTREFIRYAVLNGCKTVIIDPVTKLSNTLDSSKTEELLRKMADELACMAQDMDFFYIVTCHLKAPQHGLPHERGGKVQSYQFRGSRAMMENCYYMLGIERNKDPDITEDERNTSTFVLLEDRNFGNSTSFKVKFDKNDQSYLENAMIF